MNEEVNCDFESDDQVKNIIRGLMHKNPNQRMSVEQALGQSIIM